MTNPNLLVVDYDGALLAFDHDKIKQAYQVLQDIEWEYRDSDVGHHRQMAAASIVLFHRHWSWEESIVYIGLANRYDPELEMCYTAQTRMGK